MIADLIRFDLTAGRAISRRNDGRGQGGGGKEGRKEAGPRQGKARQTKKANSQPFFLSFFFLFLLDLIRAVFHDGLTTVLSAILSFLTICIVACACPVLSCPVVSLLDCLQPGTNPDTSSATCHPPSQGFPFHRTTPHTAQTETLFQLLQRGPTAAWSAPRYLEDRWTRRRVLGSGATVARRST